VSFADIDLALLGETDSPAGLDDSGAFGLGAFSDEALDLCFSVPVGVAAPDLDFALITSVLALESVSGGGECET
jgi:hypothetical protein